MYLIYHITLLDQVIKGSFWLYGKKVLFVCIQPAWFFGHKYCGSGDIIFLNSSRDRVLI